MAIGGEWSASFETKPSPALGLTAQARASAGTFSDSPQDPKTRKMLAAAIASVDPMAAAEMILNYEPSLMARFLELAASKADRQGMTVAASVLRERAGAARQAFAATAEQSAFVAQTNATMRAPLNETSFQRPYVNSAGERVFPLNTPTAARAAAARKGGR